MDTVELSIAEMQQRIEDRLVEIEKTLALVKETLVRSEDAINKVAAEVMPTLNQVMESPMLRMLTGGKKK